MAFISSLQDPNALHDVWIGGVRNGRSFRWIDGSAFTYQNWNNGEPNDVGGNEDCIEFYSHPKGQYHDKWNDRPCNGKSNAYLCKKNKK